MPVFPVPPWMRWQLMVQPLVRTDFRRPFYLNPSNNLPGARPAPQPPEPAPLVHVPKQTKREALAQASAGTMLPGLKVTDG